MNPRDVVPVNPNAINIPQVPVGWFSKEFDSTYPQRLKGIITSNEFQESIQNINRKLSSKKPLIILLISVLIEIVSIALFVVGAVLSERIGSTISRILIYGGIGINILAIICFFIVISFAQSRRPILINPEGPDVPTDQNISSEFNQTAPQLPSSFNQQNSIPQPTVYSIQTDERFCPQCRTPRHNLTEKHCSFCHRVF
ncbi:unnamed protein product [Adineta steineri]|uniref:Uncharacterized protein n=1 Tax=Adineta steineri TaxID=433720 RepID=A0A813SCU4_9BILA|nr:unnamed protein product [Adineta steineri]